MLTKVGSWVEEFQSTRPVRGATEISYDDEQDMEISIHAPRAGRDYGLDLDVRDLCISIHAPRAGRDML